MTATIPPPNYIAVEFDLPGIEVYAPVPIPTGDRREVVPFKCPRCAASTAYSIPDGSLVCAHCGYRQNFTQEAVGSRAEDFEFTVEVVERAGRGWNVERKELVCQNCGAHTVVPADALASACPFCASNRVIQRQAPQDVLRPRFLIPFKLAEGNVRSIAQDWLGSSWMTPRSCAGLRSTPSSTPSICRHGRSRRTRAASGRRRLATKGKTGEAIGSSSGSENRDRCGWNSTTDW